MPSGENKKSFRNRVPASGITLFFRSFFHRHAQFCYTVSAAVVTVSVLALLCLSTRHQQELHRKRTSGRTAVTLLNIHSYPPEQQKQILRIFEVQDPALVTRGDHPHSYNARWERTMPHSQVAEPLTDTPRFARHSPEKPGVLENHPPPEDKLRNFVPEPASAPETAAHALPRAYDGNGKPLPQLSFQQVRSKVTAPSRLVIRQRGITGMPELFDSCGDPALDEIALRQTINALARLKGVREITVYWNLTEDL